jgi:diguanylate cyclase (GGDEF)-like protein
MGTRRADSANQRNDTRIESVRGQVHTGSGDILIGGGASATDTRGIDSAIELEQKFRILRSEPQESRDFAFWCESAIWPEFKVGILFIDVDDFKRLNSTYTEVAVDAMVLPRVQELLKQMTEFRGAAYRHGGEEFVVLLPNYSEAETGDFAERIRAAIAADEFVINGGSERITVSIGYSVWPTDGGDFAGALAAANRAEHDAKTGGKNAVRRASRAI